jgi:hypothetical protein
VYSSTFRVIVLPETLTIAFSTRVPLWEMSSAYPPALFVQITISPGSIVLLCGLPSHTVSGDALPLRTIVYPSGCTVTPKLAPSNFIEDGLIFHDPFHGFACPRQGRLSVAQHANINKLMLKRRIVNRLGC